MKTIQSIGHSEIEFSPKNGLKAEGLIAWFALAALVYVALKFINAKYGQKIKTVIRKKQTARKIKKSLKRKSKK